MAATLEQVVKQLTDSGIIAPGKLENFVPPKADPKTVEGLVQALVKSENLTRFQAQHVAAGKTKSLILGEYTILDKIGAGGMGQVFKAQHRRMKRLVAIKMLPPAMTKDAAAVARFEREVEAAAKLSHSNIVAAHDAGQANGAHFLVMEYVEGKDLSAMVKKDGPFSIAKSVNYILQAARGLEFAHSEGVVHRDIKPANLLLDKKGVVKILDMGLARIETGQGVAAQAELTGTGAIMGTVDYMAPEQGLSTKHADARADIYSLGCTLHYLLIGKAAYDAETVAGKLVAHHNDPIPDLRQLREGVPEQLQAVFKKMVAKKIEDRYQTMTEVVAELERCQNALNASASSSTSVWQATDPNQESELSIAFSHAREHLIPRVEMEELKPKPKPVRKAGKQGPPWKNTNVLAGAGAAAFFFLLLGVWIIIQNEKGEEVNRIEVPDNHSVKLVAGKAGISNPKVEPAGPPKPLIAPFDYTQAHAGQAAWAKYLGTTVEQKNPEGMTLVLIPPGEFLMGSTPEENAVGVKMAEDAKLKPDSWEFGRLKEEGPQHRVAITRPYWLGMTEVTNGQFKKFAEATRYVTQAEQFGFGNSAATKLDDKITPEQKKMTWRTPGYAVADDSPVTQVTWNDCLMFCNWLSDQEKLKPCYRQDAKGGWINVAPLAAGDSPGANKHAATGFGYRLPTEAEWEYACRAGTTTQFSFGDDPDRLEIYGWFNKNSGGRAHAVGEKVANPLGLFDMHGNVYEWCQDFYAGDYYSKSSSSDPFGPSSGSPRVTRGGGWNRSPVACRSAFRYSYAPAYRDHDNGFRVARVSINTVPPVALASSTTSKRAVPAASGAGQPNQPWNTPAFQQWVKATQALPAEQQIEAVRKKLMELNPGFDGVIGGADGKATPKIEKGVVTEFRFLTDNVANITPVQALNGLTVLNCGGSVHGKGQLYDLSPLNGMPLTKLSCSSNPQLSDLSPLFGMKLTALAIVNTKVSDLSVLRGMPLSMVYCDGNWIMTDLAPLRAAPLTLLNCNSTGISNLAPLEDCKSLASLLVHKTKVTPAAVAALQKALPKCKIEWDAPAKLAYLDPAFQQWVKATQALPAEQQIEAVSKKLMELNPGYDGKVTGYSRTSPPKIEGGLVVEFGFPTDNVTDISPVRALGRLKSLLCTGIATDKGKLTDLSPLKGMPLARLTCANNISLANLSPLSGMLLEELLCAGCPNLSDLSPLAGMPLSSLNCQGNPISDLSPLKRMRLSSLVIISTQVSDLSPLQGMPLITLWCYGTPVSDLSPLNGMNLTGIAFAPSNISKGLDVIRQMKSLTTIGTTSTNKFPPAEFWKKYDAGEFGKPAAPAKLAYLDPAFQAWVKATQALPAEQQIEAVSKKLMELNPGFDGRVTSTGGRGTPKIEKGMVTDFHFLADQVTDISPVRALPGLKTLNCSGTTGVKSELSDLSPLAGMQLVFLGCTGTQVSDVSPLRGMPLGNLQALNTQIADLSPLHGTPLGALLLSGTPVSDLSPLAGLNLNVVSFTPKNITGGIDIVRQMKSLQTIGIGSRSNDFFPAAEFWKKYDAGEFGKPAPPPNSPTSTSPSSNG